MDLGINPRFYVNGILSTMGPVNYGFSMTDSIYNIFPDVDFILSDVSSLSLELGTFTRGIPFKIVLEMEDNVLESRFVVNSRENIQQAASTFIGGNIRVGGVHESYTRGREKRSAYYNKKVSEIVKELFPGVDAEGTSAKIAVYQFGDSYEFVKNVLLDIAGGKTGTPFVFFRDLAGKLVFKSIGELVQQSPAAKLRLAQTDGRETIADTVSAFLPFDERLTDILGRLAVEGEYLDRLAYKTEKPTAVDFMDSFIPLIADTVKSNCFYFGRQFNPDMDYPATRAALWANRMRAGFLSDKAFAVVPFNGKLVSGSVVDTEIFLQDAEGEPMISEAYSGKWLVERSTHLWDGKATMAFTKLVLSRSSYKPVSDSVLETDSYKGK
jgi:hypothetical protein